MSDPGRGLLTVPRVTVALAALLLVVAVVVLGVRAGGDAGDGAAAPADPAPEATPSATASPSASATASAYPEVVGVDLTEPGTALVLGEAATVAWEPRQRLVGALDVQVDAVERAPLSVFEGWRLPEAARTSTAYFVRASLRNVGTTDLSGVRAPLYLVDGADTLIQHSTFADTFRPCPSTPLPARFRPGRQVDACLVYLVPDEGEATAVSFRPTQEFSPITWTGEQTRYRPAGAQDGQGGARGGGQRGQGEGEQEQQAP